MMRRVPRARLLEPAMHRYLAGLLLLPPIHAAAQAPNLDPVELVGRAHDYRHYRPYLTYYRSDDFTFLLDEEGTGKTWRIISREPTPAYEWRMGPTYTGLKVNWAAKPRVKMVGVRGVDRIPATFHDLKLDVPDLATVLLVFVEGQPGEWKEYYVNNWFHRWGAKADPLVHRWFADKGDLYRIYGFARGQAAPFDAKSQAILERHKDNPSLMFHGRVRTAKDQPFGYELELLTLIGREVKSGGATVLFGDGRSIPPLDTRKPAK
jgi:hypothetical protein